MNKYLSSMKKNYKKSIILQKTMQTMFDDENWNL